jgi:hypothetical protein
MSIVSHEKNSFDRNSLSNRLSDCTKTKTYTQGLQSKTIKHVLQVDWQKPNE